MVKASVDMTSGTVDVNSGTLCYLATSCVPFLISTKESKLYITMFVKVCASVYGIFSLPVLQKQVVTLVPTQGQEK